MRNNEIIKRLKKIGYVYSEVETRHYFIYNCPCTPSVHPVHVGKQPSKENYVKGLIKKQLGPHLEDFGKI